MEIEKLNFLTPEIARNIAREVSTPCYVYSKAALTRQAKKVLDFPNAFGLTPRYAMKASSNAAILKLFDSLGLHIDASSAYEVKRAMLAGIAPEKISLSTQQIPGNIAELVKLGVKFNACSLHQLEVYGKAMPNTELGVRINPGLGSGGTNTFDASSSTKKCEALSLSPKLSKNGNKTERSCVQQTETS